MKNKIPERTLLSLKWYKEERLSTGGFLEAVIANDLNGAVARADEENLAALAAITRHIHCTFPSVCCGSYEAVDAWLGRGKSESDSQERGQISDPDEPSQWRSK